MNRAERRNRTSKKIKNRKWFLNKIYGDFVENLPKAKLGRCKKHHPYDCGNPNCFCCHADKLNGKRRFNKVEDDQ